LPKNKEKKCSGRRARDVVFNSWHALARPAQAGLLRVAWARLMVLLALLPSLAELLCASPAHAGVMNRESMEKAFPPPLIVGDVLSTEDKHRMKAIQLG
jgi:hypothetical protein